MAINSCPQCDTPNRDSAKFCANCGAPLLGGVEQASSQPLEQPDLQTGKVLQGRYRIEYELGRGGFGAVYRAWDANIKKACAVKENLDTSPEAQRQFQREATVLANLSHPGMVRVTDHFTIEGKGQYLVMDFVEGEDLDSLMRRDGKVPVDQAVEWVSQAADALTYLHTRQPPVVHRDIKPANIRITPEGRSMLVDFGLVKLYDLHMRTTLGARAVTPGYAPPEQYGRGTTDPRSDVYALGATLYKLLTGEEPLESVQRMVGKQMTPVQQLNPSTPASVIQAIDMAMKLEPNQRYQNVAEFKAGLTRPPARIEATRVVEPVAATQVRPSTQPTQAAAVLAAPVAAPAPRHKRSGRTFLWLGIAAVTVLFLGVILIAGAWALGDQQDSVKKTADAEFQATLEERVRTTTTAMAATATANKQATQTAQPKSSDLFPIATPQPDVIQWIHASVVQNLALNDVHTVDGTIP